MVVEPVVVLVVVAVPEVVPPFGPLMDPVVVEPVEVFLVTPLAVVVSPLGRLRNRTPLHRCGFYLPCLAR